MTEEQIKEYLSRYFVSLIATHGGFKVDSPQPDHGTDLFVHRTVVQRRPQGTRVVDDSDVLRLQLKCTCIANTYRDDNGFRYDLDAVAYNDLVEFWNSGAYVKRLLILVVLPDNRDDWLRIAPTELIARHGAYWYRPAPGAAVTENAASVRIRIPDANLVTLTFLQERWAEYYAA